MVFAVDKIGSISSWERKRKKQGPESTQTHSNNKKRVRYIEEPEDDEPNTAVTESKKQTITTKNVTMISS